MPSALGFLCHVSVCVLLVSGDCHPSTHHPSTHHLPRAYLPALGVYCLLSACCVFLVQLRLRSLAVPHRGVPFMVARRVPAFLAPVPGGYLFASCCPQVTTPATHLLPAKKEAELSGHLPCLLPCFASCAGCSGCVFCVQFRFWRLYVRAPVVVVPVASSHSLPPPTPVVPVVPSHRLCLRAGCASKNTTCHNTTCHVLIHVKKHGRNTVKTPRQAQTRHQAVAQPSHNTTTGNGNHSTRGSGTHT